MIIESLELKDYRNYENLDIKLSSGVNIFYGDKDQYFGVHISCHHFKIS